MAGSHTARAPGHGRPGAAPLSRLERRMAAMMYADDPFVRTPPRASRQRLFVPVFVLLWAGVAAVWVVHDLPLMLEFDTRRKRLLSSSTRCFMRTHFDRNQEARCSRLLEEVWIPLYPNRYRQPVARWPKPAAPRCEAVCELGTREPCRPARRPAAAPCDAPALACDRAPTDRAP